MKLLALLLALSIAPLASADSLRHWERLCAKKPHLSAAEAKAEIERLMHILRTGDEDARSIAADAMACFRDAAEPAIPLMIALFDADNGEIQANAMEAVAAMGTVALPYLIDALQSDNTNIRDNACGALGNMGSIATPALSALGQLAVRTDSAAPAVNAIRKIVCP